MNQARYIVGGSGQGQVAASGGAPEWSAGTYAPGAIVTRGPWLWRANNTTAEDPIVVEGNLGSGADWLVQTTGSSGMVQSGNELLLINNVGGQSTTAYRQNVHNGFLGKMLIVDLSLVNLADWMHFGIYDAAAAQTATNINSASSTFYGINLNIWSGSPPRVENWINGVIGTTVGSSNPDITNAGNGYSRWYLSMMTNGANWDLTLYRENGKSGSTIGNLIGRTEELVPIATFTNVARPSYTNWRFVLGARTGGSTGIFKCRGAWVRNLTSGNWSPIARLPVHLG